MNTEKPNEQTDHLIQGIRSEESTPENKNKHLMILQEVLSQGDPKENVEEILAEFRKTFT